MRHNNPVPKRRGQNETYQKRHYSNLTHHDISEVKELMDDIQMYCFFLSGLIDRPENINKTRLNKDKTTYIRHIQDLCNAAESLKKYVDRQIPNLSTKMRHYGRHDRIKTCIHDMIYDHEPAEDSAVITPEPVIIPKKTKKTK